MGNPRNPLSFASIRVIRGQKLFGIDFAPLTEMASQIYDGIAAALTDAFTVMDQSFTWKGKSYGCVLNVESATLVASKSLFTGALPKAGDVIKVQGKERQVLALANASAVLLPGGYVEPGTPYVDDPSSPAFSIHYGAFIRG